MNFSEISEAVLSTPGVEWGIIQRIEKLVRHKAVRIVGGGDTWIYGQRRKSSYRVVLGSEKNFAEFEDISLLKAVKLAFEKLQLPMPPWLCA